jgi:hypothetical protein
VLLVVLEVGEADDRGAVGVPLLRRNDREDLGVGQLTTDDHHFRLRSLYGTAEVVEGRHYFGLHPLPFQLGVQPDRRLDVMKGDEDGHGSEYA